MKTKQEEILPARALQISLGMVGLALPRIDCEIILETQNAVTEMGDKFDLKTAAEIRARIFKKYNVKT